MTLPKSLTTVTAVSKLLALSMFISLPLLGFSFGRIYERRTSASLATVAPLQTQVAIVGDKDSEEAKIERCGDFPTSMNVAQDRFISASVPTWSSDCRFIVWSEWYSLNSEVNKSGIFVYNDQKKRKEKIVSAKNAGEIPEFVDWKDAHIFRYKIGENFFTYDLRDGEILPE